MSELKRIWAILFGISSKEYAGFRIIVFTAVFCSVGLAIANEISKSPYNSYEKDAEHLDSLLAIMEAYHKPKVQHKIRVVLKLFDPNKATNEELMQVGLPSWLAKRIVNYRKSGGRFKQPEDLLKIYDFPDSLYQKLANYIVIEPSKDSNALGKTEKPTSNNLPTAKEEELFPIFDINMADTAIFQTVKGIGSKLSNRIVDYRVSLGGFISNNQLYEIYRLDSFVIEKLKKRSEISEAFLPTKMDINGATKEQLANHPYISWNKAKLIIAYRNQHGPFNSKQDLLKVYSINENWIKKIAPYLTFQ